MQTLSSKEVSEMLGKRHDNFMRDIRKYIATLGEEAPKYFVEGSYKDGLGKARACYEVTQAGCELIAGRMIGEKGTDFREKFVKVFCKADSPIITDLTVDEVAKRLGCSERNVYRIIKNGTLKSVQKEVLIPTIKTFVTEEDLKAYKAERGML